MLNSVRRFPLPLGNIVKLRVTLLLTAPPTDILATHIRPYAFSSTFSAQPKLHNLSQNKMDVSATLAEEFVAVFSDYNRSLQEIGAIFESARNAQARLYPEKSEFETLFHDSLKLKRKLDELEEQGALFILNRISRIVREGVS